jgi:hypothetical protein
MQNAKIVLRCPPHPFMEKCPLQPKRLKEVTTLQELNEYGTELTGNAEGERRRIGVRVNKTTKTRNTYYLPYSCREDIW